MPKNQLFFGDNLKVLREKIPSDSVDLVYLDPPFNSKADYNILFKEHTGVCAAAQIRAFEDTWRWDEVAASAYHDLVLKGGRVSQAMQAFYTFLGRSDMMAYLAMMAPRLVESHYTQTDDRGCFRWDNLTGPGGAAEGNPFYTVLGVEGYWRYKPERMEQLIEDGLVAIPPSGSKPALKRYIDDSKGLPLQSVWDDIPPVNSQAAERLGYQTQKPETLLERIINASSNAGDTVLDPFCGCGTAIAVAQRLGRRWIGIDITHLAITLIKRRLEDAFGAKIAKTYTVDGTPTSLFDAMTLAEADPFQFQWWALDLVHACPTPPERKKGPDKGIDGWLLFFDDPDPGKAKTILFSVKSGKPAVNDVRELGFVAEREKAALGVLISLNEPTKNMGPEATSAGFYVSPWAGQKVPKLQIITIEELLDGKTYQMPPNRLTASFKQAPAAKGKKPRQDELFKG